MANSLWYGLARSSTLALRPPVADTVPNGCQFHYAVDTGQLSVAFTNATGVGSGFLDVGLMSQPTPTALTATATLTIAQILTNLITVTSATAVTLTLPTGTLTDAGVGAGLAPVGYAFEWTIINLGSASGAVTMAAGTGHTFVGSNTVAITTSARFRTVKTATNTYVTYRVV